MILNNKNNTFKTKSYFDNYSINPELEKLLQITKKKIDNCVNWDYNKKKINIYEYIYTSSNRGLNVSKIQPISRSFFKLIEILHDFDIIKNNYSYCSIAEGPGGFLQSLKYFFETNKINFNKIYGISLLSDDKSIPRWNNKIINDNDIDILKGEDDTGDIYKLININNFINTIGNNTIEFVTCDGGIDYSNDYNNQELLSYKLLYSEIYLTLNIQKNNGNCVIKFFDILYIKTIQLLYLLYLCYDEIIICKPSMSRITNSEKYIICKGYHKNTEIIKNLLYYWETPEKLSITISKKFLECIDNYNKETINKQVLNINKIIDLKLDNKFNLPSKDQINTAYKWCKKYKIPINDNYLKQFSI